MPAGNIPIFCKLLCTSKNLVSFHDCNLGGTYFEDFLLPYLKSCSCFPQLTEIIKFMMLLSHGQSAAERRVSANKNLLFENLHWRSIHCQRMVKSNGYNSFVVLIGQKLTKSVKGPHRRYVNDLAERKKKSVNEERKKKIASLNESILSLNQTKDLLKNTIADLKKDSDEFAYKAEHETKLK